MDIQKRNQAEDKCVQLFQREFGDTFGEIKKATNPNNPIDICTDWIIPPTFDNYIKGKQIRRIYWELKHTDKYSIDDFKNDGAMIDVSKFKTLVKKALEGKEVMYCRFYNDGVAYWWINKIMNDNSAWKIKDGYERDTITYSTSKRTKKKTKAIILKFDKAKIKKYK